MRTLGTALLLVALCATPAFSEEPTIAQLIEQLGSPRFAVRERAMQALRLHGAKAIPPLEKAAKSTDPELSRRAQRLLDELNPKQDAERVLVPTKLRLNYKNVTLAEAVADLAKRTGFDLQLEPQDQTRLATKKITVETEELTVWEALAKFCDAAGVYEVPYVIPADKPPFQIPDEEENRGRRRRIVWVDSDDERDTPPVVRLLLKEGTGPKLPQTLIGALRVQVADPKKYKPSTGNDQTALTLVFTTESRVGWRTAEYVRIEKAVDSLGQTLTPDAGYARQLYMPLNPDQEIILMWDGSNASPFKPQIVRHAIVKLTLPAKKAPLLREVQGVIGAKIDTPPEVLVEIEGLFKSVNKTFTAKDGTTAKLLEADLDRENCYRLRLEVTRPQPATEMILGPNVKLGRINRRRAQDVSRSTISRTDLERHGLALRDSKGDLVPLVTGDVQYTGNGDDKREYLLYFHPLKGQESPMKLQISGRRNALIEVPFTLKDVPLP